MIQRLFATGLPLEGAAGPARRPVPAQGPDVTDSPDDHSGSLRHLPVGPRAPGDEPHWPRIGALRLSGRRFDEVPAHP